MEASKDLAIKRVQQLQLDLKLHDDNFAYNRDLDEKIIDFVENTNLNEHDYQLFQSLLPIGFCHCKLFQHYCHLNPFS